MKTTGKSTRRGIVRLSDLEAAIRSDYAIAGRKTAWRMAIAFKRFGEFFGAGCPAKDITTERLHEYAAKRMETVATGTVHTELRLLHHAFRLMVDWGRLAVMPLFPKVKKSPARKGFLEEAQIADVLARLPPDARPLVAFLAATGWRVGEVRGLRWPAVDWDAGTVRLEADETKGGEIRIFPFRADPGLTALLQQQRSIGQMIEQRCHRVVPWVFPRSDGRQIRCFRTAWRTACKRAGIPGRLVHDLRRSVVKRLECAGVPRAVAMRITGHKTESVYQRYMIVCDADVAQGVAQAAAQRERSLRGLA